MKSLDKAINEYVSALAAFEQAKKELEQALKALGLSDELVSRFIDELNVKKPRLRAKTKKKPAKNEVEEPKPQTEPESTQEDVNKDDKPSVLKPEDVKPKRRKRKNIVPIEEGQIVEDGKHFVYRIDGKLKRTKTLPLYKYGNTILSINKDGQFFLGTINSPGRGSVFPEKIIVEQVRSIIHKLETDQMEPGLLTVYEEHIRYFLPKMRILAKEQFEQLLDSYKAWRRRGGNDDKRS